MATTTTTMPKTAKHVEMVEVRKADAQARLEYHQDRQAKAHRLRKQYGYLGTDDTVLAMHYLAVAFQAEPSLAKWAASKTIHGRKPTPVEMKEITVKWLANPCCHASRARVYRAVTEGAV